MVIIGLSLFYCFAAASATTAAAVDATLTTTATTIVDAIDANQNDSIW